jgi:alkylhydroperoxidase/carboxymuconolactone decarboxylase family protein YurZ
LIIIFLLSIKVYAFLSLTTPASVGVAFFVAKKPLTPQPQSKRLVVIMSKSGYMVFQQESPEVAGAFNKLIEAIAKPSALDGKTKQLMYIAMKIVTDDVGAALAHVVFAKKMGASREEIRETVLLTLTVVVLKGVNTALVPLLEAYDKACQK